MENLPEGLTYMNVDPGDQTFEAPTSTERSMGEVSVKRTVIWQGIAFLAATVIVLLYSLDIPPLFYLRVPFPLHTVYDGMVAMVVQARVFVTALVSQYILPALFAGVQQLYDIHTYLR